MAIEWGFAGQIGGVGFGTVFLVLIILAVVIWLIGQMVSKISRSDDKANDRKKED